MKKMIKLGLVSLLAIMVASCSSNDTCEKQCPKDFKGDFKKECRMKRPCNKEDFEKCKENFEKWAKFDNLSEKEQKELIKEAKKAIDDREAKRKAYIDSINALWNDFDNLSVEQQKDLLMKKMHGPKPFGKPGFHKGPKHCKKDFHKGHGPKGPRPEGPCQFGPKPHGPHPHGPRPDAPAK